MISPSFTAEEIASRVKGRLIGDPNASIDHMASLENAVSGALCFISHAANVSKLASNNGALVMIPEALQEHVTQDRIIVDDVQLAYARASHLFANQDDHTGVIHSAAIIDPSATIAVSVNIGPLSVIGANVVLGSGVTIGSGVHVARDCVVDENTHIADGVYLNPKTRIGKRCMISSGTVIGASGFGYAWNANEWLRIEQLGGVDIGDDVDIGAGCTIDRGAINNTVIEHGVKLDNQVMIAHNVKIGANTIMAGCVAVAGSTIIGQRCRFGGRSSILGQLEIGDDVIINSLTSVTKSIVEAGTYSSVIPARKVKTWRKTLAGLNRLTGLAEKVAKLEKTSKK